MSKPAVDGVNAWGDARDAPHFMPARAGALNFAYRRWPSAVRVLGHESIEGLPTWSEQEIYSIIRYWMEPARRKTLRRSESDPENASIFRDWLGETENKWIRSWWKHNSGWRSPREFPGYRKIEKQSMIPHVEPYEVANLRLPDDISTDADVVLFRAWCEGVMNRFIPPENPLKAGYRDAIRSGLVKFCSSPWVALALAAPAMAPTGVLFPEVGYFASSERMVKLVRRPYEATNGELEHILRSQMFLQARVGSAKIRARRALHLAPAGEWYVGGAIRNALGPNFTRGGAHHASPEEDL